MQEDNSARVGNQPSADHGDLPRPTTSLREQLAALSHEQWAGWMSHLFKKCDGPDANVIPSELVSRWYRQIATPYAQLGEAEKDSDRKEADRILELVEAHVEALAAEKMQYEQEIRQMLWLHHGCVTALYGDDGEMQCGRHCLDFKRQPLDELREAVRSIKWQLLGEAAERAEKEKTEVAEVSRRLAQVTSALEQIRDVAEMNIGLTDASTKGGQSVGRSASMRRSMAFTLKNTCDRALAPATAKQSERV